MDLKSLGNKLLARNIDLGLLILRLSVGILIFLHGIFKLQDGIVSIEGLVTAHGLPSFLAYGVYVGEVIAPIFIILGLGTRLAAFILSYNCAIAVTLAHLAQFFTLNESGGWSLELLGLYYCGALVLVCTGGGKYALSSKYIWD
jgi:putative oxidoreductase